MTLIDHTEEWLSMMNALNATEDGEISEEAEVLMNEIEESLADKVDGCVGFRTELEARQKLCSDMADAYARKAYAWEKKKKWLEQRILFCLQRMGQKSLETALHKISVAANGGLQGVELTADDIPKEYVKIVEKASPDLDRMRKELLAGKELSFAKLKERGVHLRIA